MTNHFIHEYFSIVNANTRAFFSFYITNRWLAIRLDAITTLVSGMTALFIVVSRGSLSPALAGLALSYSLQMSGMFQFTVRLVAETQSRFVSVERIQDYIRTTPQEGVPPELEDEEDYENGNSSHSKTMSDIIEENENENEENENNENSENNGGEDDNNGIISGASSTNHSLSTHHKAKILANHLFSTLPFLDCFSTSQRHTRLEEPQQQHQLSSVRVHKPLIDVPEDWPSEGKIEFRSVKLRYRENLPLVLKKLNCKISGKEKIGIAGRTGAGKSSIAVALFRLVELSGGSILIDGVDISRVELSVLRSRLSIIPQDPVLFVGTIRYNLDPFEKYTDQEIWDALSKAHMESRVRSMPLRLETPVVENGENFSVGERQLFCMARALLRHSKILVLDESTSAIDTETDALVQKTIRECFQDCTLLTIAHRLNTILDSDKILVMADGAALEYDTPSNLLANSESKFSSMIATSEQSNF